MSITTINMSKNHLFVALALSTSTAHLAFANVIIPDFIAIYGISGIIGFIPVTIIEAFILKYLLKGHSALKKDVYYWQTLIPSVGANIVSTLAGFAGLTQFETYNQFAWALPIACLTSTLVEASVLFFFLKKWIRTKRIWISLKFSFLMNLSSYIALWIFIWFEF